MRTVTSAITWELFIGKYFWLAAGLLGSFAFTLLILTALQLDGPIAADDPVLIMLHMTLGLLNAFCFAAAVFGVQGHPSRLYSFPLQNSTIALCHLLPGMAAVAIASAFNTAACNAIFGFHWPLAGPALFFAVAYALISATAWLVDKSPYLPFAVAIVAAPLAPWFNTRYGPLTSKPTHLWQAISPSDVAVLLTVAIVAYTIAVAAIARNRRGEAPFSLGIRAWLDRAFGNAPLRAAARRTPAEAQFWLEWHKKGWLLPSAVLMVMAVGLVSWLAFSRSSVDLLNGLVFGGGILALIGILGGLVFGNCGTNDTDFAMGPFLATRPLTNTQLAYSILKAAARSVAIAWLIWLVAFAAVYAALSFSGSLPPKLLPRDLGWLYLPAMLLGLWISVTTVGACLLTGRRMLFMGSLVGMITTVIGWSLFSKYALSEATRPLFVQASVALLSLAFIFATAWLFVAARRRGLIDLPTLYASLCLWLLGASLAVGRAVLHPEQTISLSIFAIGLFALAIAPFAAAPLAVSWNRNR